MEGEKMKKYMQRGGGMSGFGEDRDMDVDDENNTRGEGQTVLIDDKTLTFEDLKFTDDLDSDAEDK